MTIQKKGVIVRTSLCVAEVEIKQRKGVTEGWSDKRKSQFLKKMRRMQYSKQRKKETLFTKTGGNRSRWNKM